MNPLRFSAFLIAAFLLSISVTLIGLVGHQFAYIDSRSTRNARPVLIDFPGMEDWPVTLHSFASLPARLEKGSLGMMMVAACLGALNIALILGLLFKLSAIRVRRKVCHALPAAQIRRPFSQLGTFGFAANASTLLQVFEVNAPAAMIALALLQVVINIATVAFAFVQSKHSSVFDINAATDGESVYSGPSHFTLETFSCGLAKYPSEQRGTFERMCEEGVSDCPANVSDWERMR
ncbi:hypothetical protein MMC21_005262 [Puttea exsequens]|nr:hypothetical protein [Puttea exsequens]